MSFKITPGRLKKKAIVITQNYLKTFQTIHGFLEAYEGQFEISFIPHPSGPVEIEITYNVDNIVSLAGLAETLLTESEIEKITYIQ